MKIIEVINGQFKVPKEFELTKEKRKLHIKTPWMSQLQRYPKDSFQVSIQCWHRHKPQKPYVPEGFIEIDKVLFKVKEIEKLKGKQR